MDRQTGTISTSFRFSCLTVGDYRLHVVAKNSTIKLTTTVTVRVKSVNRHGPEFDTGFYSVTVPDDTVISTCILQVSHSLYNLGNR